MTGKERAAEIEHEIEQTAAPAECVMIDNLVERGTCYDDAVETVGGLYGALAAAGYEITKSLLAIGGDTIITETEECIETKQGLFARRTRLGYPPLGWTCFHCGETFTTPGEAKDHFGCDQSFDPACRIKLGDERRLVMEIRKAESEIMRLRSEEKDYQDYVAAHRPAIRAGDDLGNGLVAVPRETDATCDDRSEFNRFLMGIGR